MTENSQTRGFPTLVTGRRVAPPSADASARLLTRPGHPGGAGGVDATPYVPRPAGTFLTRTLTIDDPAAGGSDDGAWATAIAHTPHLAAQARQ